MTIRFDFEWEAPGLAGGAELRATWARLQISVGNSVVTRVVDRATRAAREAIYVPLFPLAEWLTGNWFFLFAEVGSRHTRNRAYLSRHSVNYSGDGFVMPNLSFLPEGELIEAKWNRWHPQFSNIEFLDSGSAHLPLEEVRFAARELIEGVLTRLDAEGVGRTSLHEEWDAIQSLSGDEEQFAFAAAALGIDPFAATAREEKLVLLAHDSLPPEVLPDFLAITRPQELERQLRWIRSAIETLDAHDAGLRDLPELSERLSLHWRAAEPYDVGYDVARRARQELGINGYPVPTLPDLTRLLAGTPDMEEAGVFIEPNSRQQVHALAVSPTRPKFLLTREREDSQRFALARGIFDYIAAPAAGVAIVADSFSAKDKASRAFAAEFLAPSEALRSRVTSDAVGDDELFELADEFGVSTRVIENQLRNFHIAEISPPVH